MTFHARRYLAPLALSASVLAVVVVVHDAGRSGLSAAASKAPARGATRRPGPARVTVHAGDTLSRIAVRRGVAVAELRRLNPRVDPRALTPGQRLRLR